MCNTCQTIIFATQVFMKKLKNNFFIGFLYCSLLATMGSVHADTAKATKAGPDMIKAMSSELIFDFLGVRLNTEKALAHHFKINFIFPDRNEKFLLELNNAHLNNIENIQDKQADLTVTINRKDFNLLLLKQQSFEQLLKSGAMKFDGNGKVFGQLLMMMDEFTFWFNIVTP